MAAAEEIRALASKGARQVELARRFSISEAAVRAVLTGRTWKPKPARPSATA
jgi:DNA-binding CsgD family transcriptional regulator